VVLPGGALSISDVGVDDISSVYRCRTLYSLTQEVKLSDAGGRVKLKGM
jgi:hypothetical protein